jgi:DNA-directed RNA polymerase sigma subunit (sigma70/sigma32)
LEEKLKRAKEIWELRTAQHLTLQAIGLQKGVTRERVRQILVWYKKYTK